MKLPALPSLPLKRDPKAALAKAQLELTQAEAKLSELVMQRGAALTESEDIGPIASLDASIDAQHKAIGILTDRCAALARQVRALDHERLEAERTAAVTELEKAFKKRVAIAVQLEEVVTRLGDLWAELLDSREPALEHWPEMFARPAAETLRNRQMERELSWALYAAGRPVMGTCKIPAPGNIGLGVTGISPKGLAGVIEEEHQNILQVLRTRPLPSPDGTEEQAA